MKDKDLFAAPSKEETDLFAAPTTEEDKSTEAFLGGAFQDLSLGFSDEIKGALEAAGQAVGIKGLGQELGKQELQQPIGLDKEKLTEVYREGRDLERQRLGELKAEEPTAFTAGEVTGMVGPAIATGGAAAAKGLLSAGLKKAGKETAKKQIGKLAASGATMGGAGAAGYSEVEATEKPEELAKEIGTGAILGTAASLAVPGATKLGKKAIKKAGNTLKEGTKQITSVLAGLKKGTVEDIIERADDIKNALDYPEIQEIVMDKTRKVMADINKFGKVAGDTLPDEKSVPKAFLHKQIDSRINKIANTADDSAVPHLQKIKDFINDKSKFDGELISLKDMQKIVQDTGKRAYRGVAKDSPNAVKQQLRSTYYDLSEILKEAAPKEFRQYQKEISSRYDLLDRMDKKLGIRADFDEIVVDAEDKLMRKLQEVGKEDLAGRQKTDIENLLKDLEDIRGVDAKETPLADLLKARKLQGELEKGGSEYSFAARSVIGSIVGNLIAPGIGTAVGTAAGLASRPVTRAALKRSGALGKAKLAERGGKLVDKTAELATPATLGQATSGAAKIAVDSNTTSAKLNDDKYIQDLISEFESSELPGASNYANQLEKYRNTENDQEKLQIQYSLTQQPAFRKLLKEYDELKKK